MAGQNLERREMLRALSLAAGAAQFPGFAKWAFADPEAGGDGGGRFEPAGPQAKPNNSYKPQFFTGEEYEIVSRLTEMIIPTDGTPGRSEEHTSELQSLRHL